MSEGDDDLFARWSRRKRAARSLEARNAREAAQAARLPAAEAEADRPLAATGPGPAEQPEPIPSLEEITADSDLSAFLRDGVPTALKNAAMRKMWSLDPAIRDHVGLAEYAWDFNRPGSMAGFAPLEAGKSVADFLSTTSGAVTADSEGPAREAPEPPSERVTAVAPEQASGIVPDGSAQPPVMREAPSTDEVAVAPGIDEAAGREESSPATRHRHGGALPR
jgi:hypothetical protein